MDWVPLSHGDLGLPRSPGIYVVRHLLSGKEYVGLSKNIKHRLYRHKKAELKNSLLHTAIRKWGADQFEVAVLAQVPLEDYQTLMLLEVGYIKERNTRFPGGYNIRDGGVGGFELNAEERQAHSERARKSRLGTKHSPEARAKISAALRGQKRSPEQRERISQGKKGRSAMHPNTRKVLDEVRQARQRAILVWCPESISPAEYGTAEEAGAALGMVRTNVLYYVKNNRLMKNGTLITYAE